MWGQEMDSPRGRIYLIKLASQGEVPLNPGVVKHFDSCLGCMSCMTACPSGVDYGKLIEATRAQIERRHERSFVERLHRKIIFGLFPYPERLRPMRAVLRFYQSSGLETFVRKSGLLSLLPPQMRAMEALAPRIKSQEEFAEVTPARESKRRRVGLLLGCVQREFLSEVNAATIRVLAAEGCEVVAPKSQPCCGALMVHAGEESTAIALAKRMIDEFRQADVEVIITNAGGCGSHVKEYGHLLRDDVEYAEAARGFAAKCKDVTEFLAEMTPWAARHPLTMRAAYHDSCHLQHAQRVHEQPRAALRAIPKMDLVDMPEGAICCGSAGIYNLVQPVAANQLADRKAGHVDELGVQAVVTGNAGCLLQLRAALDRRRIDVPVLHTIQLLDASIHNRPLAGME
jgi:glycolate oxidase iron-sulfur subunit